MRTRATGSVRTVVLTALLVAVPGAVLMLWLDRHARSRPNAWKAHELHVERTPLKLPLVEPRIVIAKAARRLTLYAGGTVVRTYRIGLGTRPAGDKTREGDGRTPEGEFYITNKNPHSRYHLSLGLSYPGKTHAARGLKAGLITREQHDAIVSAIDERQIPPWKTSLGGEIFIHGGGSASDWTVGCIALDDEDIAELFDAVPTRTPVLIEP
ncbi:MAG TPA: L,D-transpeptidase [Planctomycetota bacterium]|nr:L,D-transpeptidase [Planctomycetota bacterium]